MALYVFGIRHHGPGCARSLLAALDELEPEAVVIEGPADAEEALPLAASAGMSPPVALLLYPPDAPQRAVYYPFAVYSPEWQAIRWALAHGRTVRLMDLPQSQLMALDQQKESENGSESNPSEPAENENTASDQEPTRWRTDPIALLAEAAGYADHELWWEQQIERRVNAGGLFEAILAAMRTLRDTSDPTSPRDLLREAHMRKTLRSVAKQQFERVAVVCGAWHAPVLDENAIAGKREGCRATDDNARLRGLAKLKTSATWIPWTHSRLSYRSGYGAGVESPGWYEHLWHARELAPTRWLATAARLLREKDLDASSASVIEAIRLADALAAVRELQSPGLAELREAILTVLCHGEPAPMQLIRDRLEIGDNLGQVSQDAPTVPLARDVAALQKRLRLKPSPEIRHLDLDVRKENDLARSHLLHRLALLGIPWGELRETGGRVSTFREIWQIQWQVEFAVAIIESNVWGNTVELAATAKVIHDALQSQELADITALLDASIQAGLTTAVDPLLERIQSQAAVAADVRHLMDAILPLARIARYGDVRGTAATQVMPILVGMFERACVGLSAACNSLDDEAAERMLASIAHVQQALDILNRDELQEPWQAQLSGLMHGSVHALLRGGCCRMLLEKSRLSGDELYRAARLALSRANPPSECAAWATGLLRGSGLLLLHQDLVWQIFDRWLAELDEKSFVETLPLLRRAFADFSSAERRQMGEKVKHLTSSDQPETARRDDATSALDLTRAKLALPVLAQILGVEDDGNQQ